jgi:hypothetical protein
VEGASVVRLPWSTCSESQFCQRGMVIPLAVAAQVADVDRIDGAVRRPELRQHHQRPRQRAEEMGFNVTEML